MKGLAIKPVAIFIALILVFIIILVFANYVFDAKIGKRVINLVGTVLLNAIGYTGIFGGLVKGAFSGLSNVVNF